VKISSTVKINKIDQLTQNPTMQTSFIQNLLANPVVLWLTFIGIVFTIISGMITIFPSSRLFMVEILQKIFALAKFGNSKQRKVKNCVISFLGSEVGKEYLVCSSNKDLTRKVYASFKKLKRNKAITEIEEDVYYVYLFALLEKSVSRIWAASISDPLEWTDSIEEKLFLELNIKASKRRIPVERIFIVKESEILNLLSIIPIQKQIYESHNSQYYFTYYAYESEIPTGLMRDIANGFLGFDDFVVARDVFSDQEIRGIIDTEQLARSNKIFTRLRQYTHPLDISYFKLKMKRDLPNY
jgi:hypothetical protein